jgi:hypothetical protein
LDPKKLAEEGKKIREIHGKRKRIKWEWVW